MTITNATKKLCITLVAVLSMLVPTLAFAEEVQASTANVVGFTIGIFVSSIIITIAMHFVLLALIKRENWD